MESASPTKDHVQHTASAESPPPLEATEKNRWDRLWPVIACGAGLFSDGYLNNIIGPVNTMLQKIYGAEYSKSAAQSNVSSITFAGTVVGMLIFGFTSDRWSRKWSLFLSTILLIIFAALCAGAYGAGGSAGGLFVALTAYRFFLGIGIGGEYPAGSVGCAESSAELKSGTRNRWFILFTNVQIDVGFVVAAIVATIVVVACTEAHLRAAWRICLGLGVIPPLSLLYLRVKLQEPEAYKRATALHDTRTPYSLVLRFYWLRLAAVSLVWFAYDFSAYAFGLYAPTILASLLGEDAPLWRSFAWNILINAFYLPGCVSGALAADRLGPRRTLVWGMAAQAAVGYIMAGCYSKLRLPGNVAAFCVVYGIFLSLGEFGPGDNIGLMASKSCATAIRGQYYGTAAAIGKVGAFVGTYAFPALQDAAPDATQAGQYPFWLASSLAAAAAVLAWVALPEVGQDEVEREDERFRAFLRERGWGVGAGEGGGDGVLGAGGEGGKDGLGV